MARYTNKKTGKEVETIKLQNQNPNYTYFRRVKNDKTVGFGSVSILTENFLKTYDPQ